MSPRRHLHSVQQVFSTDLENHPVVISWRAFDSRSEPIRAVQILKEHRNDTGMVSRGVYRLEFDGGRKASVIAKRTRSAAAHVERSIYREVMRRLPVSSLTSYGIFEEPHDDFAWHFLEDAGNTPFRGDQREHLALKGQWLGRFHVGAADLHGSVDLPSTGATERRECLQSLALSIREHLSQKRLDPAILAVFAHIEPLADQLLHVWSKIEATCGRFPQTIVHGDFVSKNMCVTERDSRLVLLPFDWQTAGWAPPAADLAPGFLHNPKNHFLASYAETVGKYWPDLGAGEVTALARIGSLFRTIVSIEWDLSWIQDRDPTAAVERLHAYRKRLNHFLTTFGFESHAGTTRAMNATGGP